MKPGPKGVSKKQIEDAEREIARLGKIRSALEEQMAQPDFYSDPKKSGEVQKAYSRVTAELEAKEEAWLLLEAG